MNVKNTNQQSQDHQLQWKDLKDSNQLPLASTPDGQGASTVPVARVSYLIHINSESESDFDFFLFWFLYILGFDLS